MPKDAWGNLKKIFAASTTARKIQFRQELSNVRQWDMLVVDYTSKIKDFCDSFASIDVNVEEGEMVQICPEGLAFRTAVCTRENTSSFFDLQSMLLVEENHAGALTSTHADNKMLHVEEDRPRGRGGRGKSARNEGGRSEQERRHSCDADNSFGPSGRRGSQGGTDNREGKPIAKCWYCGKKGYKESECWKKRVDSEKSASRLGGPK